MDNQDTKLENAEAEGREAESPAPQPNRIVKIKKNWLTGKTKTLEFEEKAFLGIKYKKKIEAPKSWYMEVLSWVLTFVVALVIVIPVRFFIFEPVRVDGHSMDDSLANGEILWVDKTQYASGWLCWPWQSDEDKQDAARFTAFGDPKQFDVVICRYPNRGDTNFVKRVIGMPGDTLALDAEGYLWVNDVRYDEPYVSSKYRTGYLTPFGPFTVPKKGDELTFADGAVHVNGVAWPWGAGGEIWGQSADGHRMELKFNGLYLDGKSVTEAAQVEGQPFVLQSDYYFVMGDHRNNSNDSRAQGPIERSMIIGRASQVLFPFGSWRPVLNGLDWQ